MYWIIVSAGLTGIAPIPAYGQQQAAQQPTEPAPITVVKPTRKPTEFQKFNYSTGELEYLYIEDGSFFNYTTGEVGSITPQ